MSFGDVKALDHADLVVHGGDVHALIGPNGAGKTTLANVITGHVAADAGDVTLDGRPVRGAPWRRARSGIGRKFQIPRVFPRLTGLHNLELANPGLDPDDLEAQQLAKVADRTGDELSHGQRQWLELHMVLVQRPRVVVLDEPTAGLTQSDRKRLADALRRRRENTTYLVVEHDLDFVASIADVVSFMAAGRIVCTGTYEEIRDTRVVRETYLGTYA